MPEMNPVYSTHVKAIGHDPDTQELHVMWDNGRTSVYEGVPANVAKDVQNSWSVGQAVRAIRDQYPHRYKG